MKRNILKRITAMILTSIICAQSISAEGILNIDATTNVDELQTTITVEDITEANPGDIVIVPVTISNNGDDDEWNENNTGLMGLQLNFQYDASELTYTGATKGSALSGLAMTPPGSNYTPGDINFI